jgi:thioredoxin 1
MKETAVSTTTLNMENFEKTVTGDGITLVDFWAEWCGPCKMFGPIFEQTSEENPDVTFAKVDTEAEQQLAGALGIMSIPTLMIFRDGIQLFSQAGALPKSALDDLLRQVRELDMDEIRRQVENHDGHDHDGHDHDGHDHDGHDHDGHDHAGHDHHH